MQAVLQDPSGGRREIHVDERGNFIQVAYKPGSKSPRKSRIPPAQCADGNGETEFHGQLVSLQGQGYEVVEMSGVDADQAGVSAQAGEKFMYSVEGTVELSQLSDELQRRAQNIEGFLVIGFEGGQIRLPTSEAKGRKKACSGNVTGLNLLVELLTLQKAVSAEIQIVQPQGQTSEEIKPRKAARKWPELYDELESRGLVLPRKVGNAARNWIF